MYIYNIAIILVLSSLIFYRKNTNISWIYIINCIFLFLIIALRDSSVGNDTEGYVSQALGLIEHAEYKGNIERLWVLLTNFIRNNPNIATLFLPITALLQTIPLFYFIHKESNNEIFSLLIFILLNTGLCFNMTGIRQAISVAFVLLAFMYLKDNKYILSTLYFVIGIGFHATAFYSILFIPFIFLRIKRSVAYSILAISVVLGLFAKINLFSAYSGISGIFSFLDFYSSYSSYEIMRVPNLSGLIMIVVPSSIIAVCAVHDNFDNPFTRLFISGVILVNLFASTPTIERYFMYVTMLQLILLPNLFKKGNVISKLLLLASILLLFINFFKSVPYSTGTENYQMYVYF